jgi:hypothetical protein
VLASPREARRGRIGSIAAGAFAGSYWFAVNLFETGGPLGERPDTDLISLGQLRENLLAAFARILDAFDLSGAEGVERYVVPGLLDSDVVMYLLAAAVLTIALLGAARRTSHLTVPVALAAGALTLLPLLIAPLGYAFWRVFAKTHDLIGSNTPTLPAGEWPSQSTASESLSWFGPVGLYFVVGGILVTIALRRRGALPPLAALLAAAPLAAAPAPEPPAPAQTPPASSEQPPASGQSARVT